jgi:hypothetical protein
LRFKAEALEEFAAKTRSGEPDAGAFENRRAADVRVREHRKRGKHLQMTPGVEFGAKS